MSDPLFLAREAADREAGRLHIEERPESFLYPCRLVEEWDDCRFGIVAKGTRAEGDAFIQRRADEAFKKALLTAWAGDKTVLHFIANQLDPIIAEEWENDAIHAQIGHALLALAEVQDG